MLRLLYLFIFTLALFACNQQNKPDSDTGAEPIRDTTEIVVNKTDTLLIRDTVTLTNTGEMKIPINSASNNILYWNCGNTLLFDLPPDFGSPVVTASDAEVVSNKSDLRRYQISPSGKTCEISLSENKNGTRVLRSTYQYKVIKPPKPSIELIVNGNLYDEMALIPKTSRVQLIVRGDPDFQSAFPRDARYQIGKIDVLAQLSLGPPTKINSINAGGKSATQGIAVDLGTQVRQARPGTTIFIQFDNLYRINYKNQNIKENLSFHERTFAITIR